MRRFPRAQRAIAGMLREMRVKAGYDALGLANELGESQHYIRRIERLERDVSVAEFMAIARKLGVRPSTLLARIERRLRA